MRCELGQVFRSQSLAGQVTTRSEDSVFVELRDLGFMTVISNCNGEFDCVITLVVPTHAVAHNTIDYLRQNVIEAFDLDPAARYLVKICQPFQQSHGAYLAEPAWPLGSQNKSEISWTNFASRPDEALYSVPRRYDLASMFAISVAYAMLFAIMRAFSAPPSISLLTGVFLAVVGAAQAVMFEGNSPREASIISGGVAGFTAVIVFAVLEGVRLPIAFPQAVCSIAWGPLAGYLAGTIVGGIWLTADYLRKSFEYLQTAPPDSVASAHRTIDDLERNEPK